MMENSPVRGGAAVYNDADAFLRDCSKFLCQNEAANNLILGITGELARGDPFYNRFFLATGGDPIDSVVMMTPPNIPIISFHSSERSIVQIVDKLIPEYSDLAGVNGPSESSAVFARVWAQRMGVKANVKMILPCFQLSSVNMVPNASGMVRKAEIEDIDLMMTWYHAFCDETGMPKLGTDEERRSRLLSGIQKGEYYFWHDNRIVAMLKASGRTPDGIRIGFVYTPPESRGNGYASSLVAQVSQEKLDEGIRFCFLFTDAKNPTSNKIYQRIGYEKVCEFWEYEFERGK